MDLKNRKLVLIGSHTAADWYASTLTPPAVRFI